MSPSAPERDNPIRDADDIIRECLDLDHPRSFSSTPARGRGKPILW